MQLYNKLSANERAELIEKAGKERLTLSFYKYARISNPQEFRDRLFIKWNSLDVLGRIYVATEGINAQLSLPAENFENFKTHLDSIDFLENVRLNIAVEQDNMSFLKLKVKVRDKIVADGLNDDTFDVTNKGIHVNAEMFNDLIEDENTVLVDMRNHYESEIGHFKNAVTQDVDTFRESLDIIEDDLKAHKEDKKLVMYCTGGIRCEKATAYMAQHGVEEVYQLNGGILQYLEDVSVEQSRWRGECFVFDQRVSVDHKLQQGQYRQCYACRHPLSAEDVQAPEFEHGVSCPYCHSTVKEARRQQFRERQRQVRLAAARGESHIGVKQKSKRSVAQ